MTKRGIFAALLLSALFAAPALADSWRTIDVAVRTIAQFGTGGETRFGDLEFRGGIALSSPDPDFGGLSGLDIGPNGSLLAVADNGFWFSARVAEKDGVLAGIDGARLAPILDANGKTSGSKRASDAEGLRVTDVNGQRTALVSFEQDHRVSRFAFGADLGSARAKSVKLPNIGRSLSRNAGLETIAVAPAESTFKGATVLVAEHSLDKSGNHRGWILGGPHAGTFSIRRIGNFDITDGDFLPNGDLIILERLFNSAEGLGMRMRRIPAADIAPGKTADGPILMAASLNGHRIDNMEGLSLRPEADGSTSIFIISDDNQSFLQQTLLLKFSLPVGNTQ